MTAKITQYAYAKVNLALHITGQRADGYHELDSLVAFGLECFDRVDVELGTSGFSVSGPMASPELESANNLCVKAANLMGHSAAIHLEKHLPVQAGIGGGSADAAAVLRAIAQATGDAIPIERAVQLGADVPVCCHVQMARMRGIGEDITRLEGMQPLHGVLVNPRVHVATPDIFKALHQKNKPPLSGDIPHKAADLIAWLRAQRNDMQAAAIAKAPEIGTCLAALEHTNACQLARMSGSGATCFGLYPSEVAAQQAAQQIAADHPHWWVCPTRLGSIEA